MESGEFQDSNLRSLRMYDKPLAYIVTRDKFDYLLTSGHAEAGAKVEDEIEIPTGHK